MAEVKNYGLSGVHRTLQLGKQGPVLVGNADTDSFTVTLQDAATLTTMGGANASSLEHFVTKAQLDVVYTEAQFLANVNYNDSSPILLGNITAGTKTIITTFEVDSIFDGNAVITIGTDDDNSLLMSDDYAEIEVAGVYQTTGIFEFASNTSINVYVTQGGATAGAGKVLVSVVDGPVVDGGTINYGGGSGSGIALTDLSVTTASPSGNGSLTYNDTTGEFTFTPANVGSGAGSGTIDLSAVDQDIIPDGNLTRSLGSPTNQWADLYIGNATIYLNNIPLGLNSDSQLTFNGNVIADSGGGGGTSYNQSLNTSDNVLFNSVGSVDGFVCVGTGTPTVEGDTDLILKASHRILIDTGVLNIPTRTTAEVGNISLTDGDMYVRDEDGVLRAFVQSRECSVMLRVAVPTTSLGEYGDVPGLYATDSSYFYVCLNQYDGTTNIWRRIAIPSTTW